MAVTVKSISKVSGHYIACFDNDNKKEGKALLKNLTSHLDFKIESEAKRRGIDLNKEGIHHFQTPHLKNITCLSLISYSSENCSCHESLRKSASSAFKQAKALDTLQIAIDPTSLNEGMLCAIYEGLLLSDYSFSNYFGKSSERKLKLKSKKPLTVSLVGNSTKTNNSSVKTLNQIAKVIPGVLLTRDLVNTPAADCTPSSLVSESRKLAKSPLITAKIFNEKQLAQKKMNGILSVGRASKQQSAFITLTYRPKKKVKKGAPVIGFIGKGITFDAGGLSIKTGTGMQTMNCDMAGAATVLGIFKALSLLQPAITVKGYIPTAENMIDGSAMRPGDVLTMMSGKTVEVLNTDAEGRLILADALHYADSDKCDYLIDFATLTGSVVAALGGEYAGLFTNNDMLRDKILEASSQTGEKIWQLPLAKEYNKLIKSDIADIKNIGGRVAGAITAALFLQNFVEKTPWAHLDIAGTAFYESADTYTPKGGTGFAVRAMINMLKNLEK